MKKLQLPLRVQNFREIREGGYCYVDKTGYISQMYGRYKYCFLSRPRGFGKSLLVDTIQQAFEGNKELFEGLAIQDKWDWSISYPVLRFDYGSGDYSNPDEIYAVTNAQLNEAEEVFAIKSSETDSPTRLLELIDGIYESSGLPVVVLVDEFDKPVQDVIEQVDVMRSNRYMMSAIFGTLKSTDAMVRFACFIGEGKYSEICAIRGLDHLVDISTYPRFAAICGYTNQEINAVFGQETDGLNRTKIRKWSRDDSCLDEERVYCPHDLHTLLSAQNTEV